MFGKISTRLKTLKNLKKLSLCLTWLKSEHKKGMFSDKHVDKLGKNTS